MEGGLDPLVDKFRGAAVCCDDEFTQEPSAHMDAVRPEDSVSNVGDGLDATEPQARHLRRTRLRTCGHPEFVWTERKGASILELSGVTVSLGESHEGLLDYSDDDLEFGARRQLSKR